MAHLSEGETSLPKVSNLRTMIGCQSIQGCMIKQRFSRLRLVRRRATKETTALG